MTDFLQSPYSYNKTVAMGIKILELISEQGILSDREIAKRLDYSLISVKQILNSYLNFGYLTRDEEDRYDLSIKIFDIGRKFKQRSNVRDIARPYMQQLVHQYNETVVLGILEGTNVMYLDKIDSLEMLRFAPQSEQRITAHHTALGKAILAHLPAEKLKHYCIKAPWKPMTPKSIDSIDKLMIRLHRIRKQGFAISDEEYCMGLRAIALPILDQIGYPKFSISIWGPVSRMESQVLREMQADLSNACYEIAKYFTASVQGQEEVDYKSMVSALPVVADKPPKTSLLSRTLAMLHPD